jgi:hypothetical protein
MNEPLHLAGVDCFTRDRIADLYATAEETRALRRVRGNEAGLITRIRSMLGRRLVTLGGAVAGHQA